MSLNYKIRKTNSGSYSIDKYEEGKFKETISQNNLFEESNEEELNLLTERLVISYREQGRIKELTSDKLLEELRNLYVTIYGEDDFQKEDGLDIEDDILNEVVERMTDYCNRYNELRFIDEHNNQYDIDRNWIKENYPEHEVLNLKYNDLDTRRNKIKHLFTMNGLNKDFTVDSIVKWIENCRSSYGTKFVHLGFKFDGAACSAIYEKSKKGVYEFSKAVTRGNGLEGDDISENFKQLKNFNDFEILRGITSEVLEGTDRIELRGEILVQKSDFLKNDFGIKNTRQYASGGIKLKDSNEVRERNLIFACYTMILSNKGKRVFFERDHFNNQFGFEEYLRSIGIFQKDIINNYNTCNFKIDLKGDYKSGIEQLTKRFYEERENLDVDIDGLVFKINDYEGQIKAGQDYAMAYKFPSENSITKVTGIEFQIGRTGRVTPVLEYEPIDILGVTCSRATLHNSDYFEEYDLSIGDEISVARNGDVIPQVQNILKRNGGKKIEFIKNCTICGTELVRDGSFHYCKNLNCGAKQEGSIFSFINSIGLNFLGNTKIKEMIENNILNRSFDILYVKEEDLLRLDRSGDRTTSKIMNSLNECIKELTFSNILDGLGVQGLGGINSYKISTYFGELNQDGNKFDIFRNNLEDIKNINGIGGALIMNIQNYLDNLSKDHTDYIRKVVEDFGIEFDKEEKIEGGKLEGKSFYITGKLSLSRGDFADKYIYSNGGTEESLKKCDYFLAGLNATSWKVEEAKNLGKIIISEEEFMRMI